MTVSILDEKFAIVDIETTGGNARRDRITEIAIIGMHAWQEISRPSLPSRLSMTDIDVYNVITRYLDRGKRGLKVIDVASRTDRPDN